MSKQIGLIILTDNMLDLRGMINQLENTFENITVMKSTPDPVHTPTPIVEVGNVPETATPVVDVAPAAQATAVELDINSMPWDARIHSSAVNEDGTHKKTAKGVWQKRRGVDDITVRRIEAEIMDSDIGQDALPSSKEDLFDVPSTPAVMPPVSPAAPVAPATPVLVLPADNSVATIQDCITLIQSFAALHGNDVVQQHLTAWNMTDIRQLPQALVAQFIDYMSDQHDQLTRA